MGNNGFWHLKTWRDFGGEVLGRVAALVFYVPFKIWSKSSAMLATAMRSAVSSCLLMSCHHPCPITFKSHEIYFHEPFKKFSLSLISFSTAMARLL